MNEEQARREEAGRALREWYRQRVERERERLEHLRELLAAGLAAKYETTREADDDDD